MNDVTYRFKSITTMRFFNLTIKCTTSDSCLLKMSLKPSTYALSFSWNGREQKINFLASTLFGHFLLWLKCCFVCWDQTVVSIKFSSKHNSCSCLKT